MNFRQLILSGAILSVANSIANATYIAAGISSDEVVFGVDSRAVFFHEKGPMTKTDDSCKLILLNDHLAFGELGIANLFEDHLVGTVIGRDVAKKVATAGIEAIPTVAKNFADEIVAILGDHPPLPMPWIGIFSGFSDGSPTISMATIDYDRKVNRFSSQVTNFTAPGRLYPFAYFEATNQIIASPAFRSIQQNPYISFSGQLPRMMDVLVTEIISRNLSYDIGGTPTILVMPKGEGPSWYKKAKDCPAL